MALAIVIPHDEAAPLKVKDLNNLEHYHQEVGGYIESIGCLWGDLTLFANEDGKLLRLPMNRRASIIWWVGISPNLLRDHICGDAVLVGPIDEDGKTQDVPPENIELLFTTQLYTIEVRPRGQADVRGAWHDISPGLFDDYFIAAEWGLRQTVGSREIAEMRIVGFR